MSSTALNKIIIPDEARIKELYEKIALRCARLQQMGQAATDYDKAFKGRLSEAILFLQNACQGSRVTNAVEQLQLLAQKLGLKCQPQGTSLMLGSDGTFSFWVFINEVGSVTGVKLILGKDLEQPDCHVMLELLRDSHYRQLGEHLESLVDLSSRLAACPQKQSALTGLLVVESILMTVYKSTNYSKLVDEILQSHLGHVIPRTGGLPMKLIIFARPNQLLDKQELSVVDPIPEDFGFQLTILAEYSPQVNILPATTSIFNTSTNKFNLVNSQNGVVAQATLVMQLLENLPTCMATLKKFHQFIYGSDQNFTAPQAKDYLELLLQGKHSSHNEARVVHLPGQRHYYLFPTNNPVHSADMISKISFLHPVAVIQIVPLLRQQLVYNILVKSCFGSASSHLSPETSDTELVCSIVEITPPSTIRLEASLMGTGPIAMVINVDQGKPTTPEVHLGDNFQSLSANLVLSQILSKCLSVPVMLYSYIKRLPQLQAPVTTSTSGWQSLFT